MPKVRGRGSQRQMNMGQELVALPPYLKRAKNVEELLAWLYLRGDIQAVIFTKL
ncbi:MAG: hypothetical protein ACTS73_05095 [Arsenophonus sp. NEOnobi-MAG3]